MIPDSDSSRKFDTRHVVKSFLTREEVVKSITKIEWDSETTKKGGYPHYMLKEIYVQPKTINTVLKLDSNSMDKVVDMISKSQNVYFHDLCNHFVSIFPMYF